MYFRGCWSCYLSSNNEKITFETEFRWDAALGFFSYCFMSTKRQSKMLVTFLRCTRLVSDSFLGSVECLGVVMAALHTWVAVSAWLVFTVSALILCSNWDTQRFLSMLYSWIPKMTVKKAERIPPPFFPASYCLIGQESSPNSGPPPLRRWPNLTRTPSSPLGWVHRHQGHIWTRFTG